MSQLLSVAESIDGYNNLCKKDTINALARSRCSYTVWNDQSLAVKAKSFLRNKSVDVVILNPSAEGGMPHTRGDSLICIPAYHSERSLEETLMHEMIHIEQKQQPALWRMKMELEGWKAIDEGVIPEIWRRRVRLNPDTCSARWFAWRGRYVPLPLFVREDKPDLRDIVVRWYDIEEGIVKSSPPSSFSKQYGELGISSLEHPYELWAYQNQSKPF
jgi:hypothetical protein